MNARDEMTTDAARMVAYAMKPGRARSSEYRRLVERFHDEPEFAQAVRSIAQGFDLTVLWADRRAGLGLGTTDETDFAVSITRLVSNPDDRPYYLLAHLAIAALAFPRPEDLDHDAFVNRVSVDAVDDHVRVYAGQLQRRAAEEGTDVDTPTGQPGLEAMWRAYLRRNATGRTKKDRAPRTTTRALIKTAFTHLKENAFVTHVSDDGNGTYATTVKYRLQVRELAAGAMLDELAALGVAELPRGSAKADREAPETGLLGAAPLGAG